MGLRFVSVFGCVNVSEAFPSEIASVDGVKYLKWIRFWFAIDSITGSGSGKSLNGQVAEDCSCWFRLNITVICAHVVVSTSCGTNFCSNRVPNFSSSNCIDVCVECLEFWREATDVLSISSPGDVEIFSDRWIYCRIQGPLDPLKNYLLFPLSRVQMFHSTLLEESVVLPRNWASTDTRVHIFWSTS